MRIQKIRRQIRTRNKLKGIADRPRISVFRSSKYMFAQVIDDVKNKTILGISEKALKLSGTKSEKAKALGLQLAKKAKAKNITKVVFDRGSYSYHGRVKSLAEGLREGGMEF